MKFDNVKVNEMTFGHIIRLVREVAVIGVTSYLAIKVFSGDLSLDFTKLSPSELVSILLAFFSILLAAAFYFAATNSSNQFYDNINKFNKDTSELLGRLDEQIKHVNTRQVELGDRIDKRYTMREDNGADNEDNSVDNESKIESAQANIQDSIHKILEAAVIEPEEKQRLEKELKDKNDQLGELRKEQAEIKAKKTYQIKRYLRREVKKMGVEEAATYGPAQLFKIITQNSVSSFKRDVHKYGFTSTYSPEISNEITNDGIDLISSVVASMLPEE